MKFPRQKRGFLNTRLSAIMNIIFKNTIMDDFDKDPLDDISIEEGSGDRPGVEGREEDFEDAPDIEKL